MLNRKFPLWGTRVPDDMPLRLTLLALPRVNRMEFLAPERGGKMLESVHPSNQVKSPLFPSICSTPGDVSAPSSPRCFLKNTRRAKGLHEADRTPGLTRLKAHAGLHLVSIIHDPPDQARAHVKHGELVLEQKNKRQPHLSVCKVTLEGSTLGFSHSICGQCMK